MEQKYIKASEVAEKFGVTRQTIRNWIDKGMIAAEKIDGCLYCTIKSVEAVEARYKDIVVLEDAVEAYIKKHQKACEEYEASIELLRQSSAENTKICLIKPRLTELVRVMFGVVRVSQYGERRGDDMIELLLHGYDVKYIAEKYGISPERVHQIVEKDLRVLDYEGRQYVKIKEENERLKEELQTLKINVNSLRSFREPGAESLEYSKVDVQENILTKRLVDCNLSVRVLNCLKSYEEKINGEWVYKDIDTIGDLARLQKTDLLKLRNFGKKCLIELDDFLSELGLEWGTNYMVNENGEVVKVEQK